MKSWALLFVLVAACAPGNGAADAEVAAEVRALRQALLARPNAAARPATATDATNALAPLREALQGLVQNQRELQDRQLALTQEMQRWSTLLVQAGTTAQREESAALAARLQQLEATLREQDARHRSMEKQLQGALDRTADRLGEFLRGVGVDVDPDPVVPAAEPPTPLPEPSPTNGAPVVPTPRSEAPTSPPPNDRATAAGRASSPPALTPWWWVGVALLGVGVGVACWRRVRTAAPALPLARVARPAPAAGSTAGGDPDVQEIWAAAALLGEAVGRLRDSTGNATPPSAEGAAAGTDPAADALDGTTADDLIVLDDELLAPGGIGNATAEAAAPARPAPSTATCRLRSTDPVRSLAAVLQILQEDPRVLRRPEPAVRCSRDCVEASFRLVPDLAPGERSHLEQRLREACAAPS